VSAFSSLLPAMAPTSRVDDIVDRISEAIHLGLLGDGEQLPVEPTLAKHFGVAPMTVREALGALRERGLIETRRGRTGGSFVRIPDGPPLDVLRARLVGMTGFALRDMVDEHSAIASEAAHLAAQRASATNIRQLFTYTEQLRTAGTLGARVRADSRFHIELAVAAQSERLTRQEVRLQGEVAGMLWLPVGAPIDIEGVVADHHQIAMAVAAEDATAARALTEQHIRSNLPRLSSIRIDLTGGVDGG